RKKIVLNSGNTGTGTGSWVNETYELDSTGAWTKANTTTSPNYYYYGYNTLLYDVGRTRVVGYGGYSPNMVDWDPATPAWTTLTTTKADTSASPGQAFVGFVYDISRSMSVLFGGQGSRTLWEWNGADLSWTNRSVPVSGPLQRQNPAIAYDTMRGKLMLFGGRTSSANIYRQDIWEWSHADANFINRTTAATKPPGRYQTAMAYDSKGDRLLLYGGYGVQAYDDFWAWHPADKTWEQLSITQTPRPPALYGH